MDRNEIISLTYKINLGRIESESMLKVIVEYCIENGKDEILSRQFATLLLRLGIIKEYFLIALEYFCKKFNICTLTDKEGTIILIF